MEIVAHESTGGEFSQAPMINTGWVKALIRLSDGVDMVSKCCFATATVAFALVMLMGVFFRYVLNNSLAWSDELALIIFVWATFLAISSGYLHDRHVNLDILVKKLPPSWNSVAKTIAEGLAGGYLVAMVVAGIEALDVAGRGHTDALRIPLTVPYAAIPLASVLMLIHWVRRNAERSSWRVNWVKLLITASFFVLVYLPFGQQVTLSGAPRTLILVAMLFGPMLIGVPVAFCLGLMATFYVASFGDVAFDTGAMQIFFGVNILTLMAIPLLILSGRLMHAAGIAKLLVDFAQVLVGRVRGGLGASNVVASFLFGDISGSAVSDTAAIGSLMIPQMKQRGYRPDFCAALQGTAGTLGMMAPLAITVLLYSSAVSTSVSRLAAATIMPAFLVGGSFMLVALVHARRHNYPPEHVPRSLIVPSTLRAMPGLFALVVVVGGIIGGVFTPAEVGTVLLTYVLLLSIFLYRSTNPRVMFESIVEAGYISGMTLFLASTSAFLGFVLARDLVSFQIVEFVSQISMDRLAVIFMVSIVFIILGMVLEPPAMIFGFLPSFVPLLNQAGVDLIHWGVLFCVNMGLGCIVPPVALNLFVSTQLAGVRYEQAVRATVPFIIIMAIDIVIMAVFPQIPLMIPHILFEYPIK